MYDFASDRTWFYFTVTISNLCSSILLIDVLIANFILTYLNMWFYPGKCCCFCSTIFDLVFQSIIMFVIYFVQYWYYQKFDSVHQENAVAQILRLLAYMTRKCILSRDPCSTYITWRYWCNFFRTLSLSDSLLRLFTFVVKHERWPRNIRFALRKQKTFFSGLGVLSLFYRFDIHNCFFCLS